MLTPKNLMNRLKKQVAAWSELAATDEFAGMTLADFQALIGEVEAAHGDSVEFAARLRGAFRARRLAEEKAMRMSKRLAMAIKSHPNHGEDSPLIRASGFKAESERRSGLTRRNRSSEKTAPEA